MSQDFKTFFMSFYKTLLLIFAVATVAFAVYVPCPQNSCQPPAEAFVSAKKDLTFLTCAKKDSRSLPQNFALVCISPSRRQIAITNLPNDLLLSFGGRQDTPTQCYAYAGMMQMVQSLQQQNIQVDFYAETDLSGLEQIVDYCEPVSFYLPETIYEYDQNGLLLYRQSAGTAPLTGNTLCGILQYSKLPSGERTALWLDLYCRLVKNWLQQNKAADFEKFYIYCTRCCRTDMTKADLKKVQDSLVSLCEGNQITVTAPQTFSAEDLPTILENYF